MMDERVKDALDFIASRIKSYKREHEEMVRYDHPDNALVRKIIIEDLEKIQDELIGQDLN